MMGKVISANFREYEECALSCTECDEQEWIITVSSPNADWEILYMECANCGNRVEISS